MNASDKNTLLLCKGINEQLTRLYDELMIAKTDAERCTTRMEITGVHSTEEKNRMAEYIVRVEDINERILTLESARRAGYQVLNRMDDPLQREICYLYYMSNKTQREIAKEKNYSQTRICQIVNR